MSSSLLPELVEDPSGDDSPFISAADFFSILSLTLIYTLTFFNQPIPKSFSEVPVVSATITGTGMSAPAKSDVGYLSLISTESGIIVRIVPAQETTITEMEVLLTEDGVLQAEELVRLHLLTGVMPTKVVMYMDETEERATAHKLFHKLLKQVRQRCDKVSIAMLEQR